MDFTYQPVERYRAIMALLYFIYLNRRVIYQYSFILFLPKESRLSFSIWFLYFIYLNRRVIFASRGEIFGSWNGEFSYTWAELKDKPKTSAKGVEIVLKEKEKRFLIGSFSKKEIHIADKKIADVSLQFLNCLLNLYYIIPTLNGPEIIAY